MGTIQFERINQLSNRFSPYAVLVNGKKVGEIANGESLTVDVPSGRHEVVVRQYRRWKSPPIKVRVEDDETTVVEVGCNVRGWRMWVPFWPVVMSLRPDTLLYARLRSE
jgi:hypothetical protein